MTNYKLHNVLIHIANRAYPSTTIEPFYVEMEKRELKSRHGCYNIRERKISINNLSRNSMFIVATAIHELAHHIAYTTREDYKHDKYYYITLHKLLSAAISLGYITYSDIKAISDSKDIEQMEKKAGRIRVKYDPSLNVNKDACTIQIRNSYPIKDKLKKMEYFYSSLEHLWEKDTDIVTAEKEKEIILKEDANVLITIKNILDLSMDIVYQITVNGDTYPIREELKNHGYYYKEKKWYKTISAANKEKEEIFLKHFTGISYVIGE